MNSFTSLTEFQSRPNKREPSVMCVDCMMHAPWEKDITSSDNAPRVFARCELLHPGQTYARRVFGPSSIVSGTVITPEDGCDLGKKEVADGPRT